MTDLEADVAELNVIADTLTEQVRELQELTQRLADEQAELRDELHTLANRHGWSVKAPPTPPNLFGVRYCGTAGCVLTTPHLHMPEGVVYT